MRKFAYHRIRTQQGAIQEGPFVVSFDDDGNFLSYHALIHEEPSTEWIGGIYDLTQQ